MSDSTVHGSSMSAGLTNMPDSQNGDRSLLQYIREDVKALRSEIAEQFRNLVTVAAFEAERRRVEDRLKDIKDDLDAERLSRVEGLKDIEVRLLDSLNRMDAKSTEENERKKAQDAKNAAFIKWAIALAAGIPTALSVWSNFLQNGLG